MAKRTDSPRSTPGSSPWPRLVPVLAVLLGAILLIQAWVAEDAFITFRVVDHAIRGYGLRWNVDERVQVFTHPLWLLLHLPVRLLTANLFLATMLTGVALTLLAVRLAVTRGARSPGVAVLALAALILSKSFVEFATSGLETSLAYALMAALIAELLGPGRPAAAPHALRSGLLIALVGLNRLDHLLLFLPAVVVLLLRAPDPAWRRRFLAGFLPLAAWELFALWYYGFAFPNTAYAKLGGGYGRMTYVTQGMYYLVDLLRRDPATAVLLFGGIALPFAGRRTGFGSASTLVTALASGLALYTLYVIGVGGDFMSGRLWSVPFFAAVCLLSFRLPAAPSDSVLHRALLFLVALRALGFVLEPPLQVEGTRRERLWASIKDERLSYARGHTFYNMDREPRFRFQVLDSETYPPMAVYWYAVGLPPYVSGPHVIVVDGLALADPLLARLPALAGRPFHIGHIKRHVPLGYLEARAAGSLAGLSGPLREYCEKLRLVTSAPLTAPGRLGTIVSFNLGRYDHLLRAYLATNPPADTMQAGVSVEAPRMRAYRKP